MRFTKVMFQRETNAVGRNGVSRCKGVEITEYHASSRGTARNIWIEPVNSRGKTTNCRIKIPVENVREVIQALAELCNLPCNV